MKNPKMINNKTSALILFIGVSQFYIFLNIAAFLVPGYNLSNNSISHLGIVSTGYIFNASIIILGITEILSGIGFQKYSRTLSIFLIIAGIGSAGVGVFNEHFGYIHLVFALLAFLFGSISSYSVFAKRRDVMSGIWAFLGSLSIFSLVLFILTIMVSNSFDLGLGEGGIERMILIPNIVWALAFSGSMFYSEK